MKTLMKCETAITGRGCGGMGEGGGINIFIIFILELNQFIRP